MRLRDLEPKHALMELTYDTNPLVNVRAAYNELYPKVKEIINTSSDRRPGDTKNSFGNLTEEDMLKKVRPRLDKLFQSFLNQHQQLHNPCTMGTFDTKYMSREEGVDPNKVGAMTLVGQGRFLSTICINYPFLYSMSRGEAKRMPWLIRYVLLCFLHEYTHYRQGAANSKHVENMCPGAIEDQAEMAAKVADLEDTNPVKVNILKYISDMKYLGKYEEIEAYSGMAAIDITERMYGDRAAATIQEKTRRIRELLAQGPTGWAELCRASEEFTRYYELYSVGAKRLMKQFIRMLIRQLDYMDVNHDPDRHGTLPPRPKLLPGANPSFSIGRPNITKTLPGS